MEIKQAKEAIKNIVEYWQCRPTEREAAEIAVAALEKQIPKKVVREAAVWPDGQNRVKLFCPACHDEYELSTDDKYCSECGQCLDWSENDE